MPWKLAHKKRNSTNFQIPDKTVQFSIFYHQKAVKNSNMHSWPMCVFPLSSRRRVGTEFLCQLSWKAQAKTVLAAICAHFLCVHSFLPLCIIIIIISSKQVARLGIQVTREKIWNDTCMYCTRSKNQIDGHIEHNSMGRNLSDNLQCGDHSSAKGNWISLLLSSSFSGHWLSLLGPSGALVVMMV